MTPAFGSASVQFWTTPSPTHLGSQQRPSVHGRSGSPERTAHVAHWASWADCLPVVKERHGVVARTMVAALHDPPEDAAHLRCVAECRLVLAGAGYDTPEWQVLADGLPSPTRPRGA